MSHKQLYSLDKLATVANAKLHGNAECQISGIAALDKAQAGQISFLQNSQYKKYLTTTHASAIIIQAADVGTLQTNLLVTDNPYLAYAKISALFANSAELPVGIHKTAVIDNSCEIATTAKIAAHCTIGRRVKIGANTEIGPGCCIADDVVIGDNSKLYSNVSIYHAVHIGKRVILHSGVVIGSDGFGNANDKGVWVKIHQLGSVIIGNDVEIGANTTVDRGALENTIIEDGVKLDNQIQIGHNVIIGAHTAIAGCTGIAGSTKIGKHCMIGGGVGISGHIEIADRTIITASSSVGKSITVPGGIYASGIPAVPHRTWWKTLARLMQLDEVMRKLKNLEK